MTALAAGCQGKGAAVYEQAKNDLEQGAYQEALQGYEEAIEQDIHTAESLRGAGVAQLKLGEYEEAVSYFQKALEEKGLDRGFRRDTLSYKATAEYKNGQYEQAEKTCSQLLEVSSRADSYYLAGRAALAADHYETAEEYFQQAAEKDSSYSRAVQIYETYLEQDMEADGTVYLEQVISTEAASPKEHCERGRVYYYMEDYENAEKELKRAVDRKYAEAMLLLGQVYLEEGNAEDARQMFRQYIEKKEKEPAAGYNGLALCDMAGGDYESALENIQKGLETAEGTQMKNLLANEVAVYEESLDFETAREKAEEYLKLYPSDEAMEKERDFLDTRVP